MDEKQAERIVRECVEATLSIVGSSSEGVIVGNQSAMKRSLSGLIATTVARLGANDAPEIR